MLADVGDDVSQVDGLAVALDAAIIFIADFAQAIAVQHDIELARLGCKRSVHDNSMVWQWAFPGKA